MTAQVDKKMIAYSNCINCNRKFTASDIEGAQELQHTSKTTLVHITCKKCSTSMLLGLVNGKAMGIVGVATDLTIGDLGDKYFNKSLTTDEIIELADVINRI